MTRSGRSLLRQASVLLLLFCFGAAYAAPILAQAGPAPEPAPRRSQVPTPEPAPGARPQTSRPATTQVSPSPVPPPVAQNPVPPPAVLVQPTAPAPPAPAQEERRQVRKRETAKEKPVRVRTTKQATRRALPSLSRTEAGSTDTMLLIGGLALVVLVLLDTVFLTLSTRVLRSAG
jgi:type IV secretory pathway VirB10-like protein